MNQPVIFLSGLDFELGRGPLDGAECFHHQHGMVGDDGASALANNGGMPDALGIAHVHNVPNDVVGIFLERIICRAVEVPARTVIINSKTAAHIEIRELVPKLAQFGIVTCRFAYRALDRGDIRHLRSDMEMKQLEARHKPGLFQHLTGCNEVGCIETEFRVLATARRPFARPFAMQAHTNADVWLDPNFVRSANDLLELLQLFSNNDDRFAKFTSHKGNANKSRIFVAVTNNQALGVLVHGERGDQFRFAARFETKMKRLTRIDDFLNHFAQLVDLDRKNAPIFVAITELRNRLLKDPVNRFDPVPEQILESDYERKTEVTRARFIHDLEKVDGTAVILQRLRLDVARTIDRKVTIAPSLHVVGGDGGLKVPLGFHFDSSLGREPQSAYSMSASNMQVSRAKIFASSDAIR